MSAMHMEREIYHTYLVWEPDETRGEDDYGIKMLQNNTFNYFLPFQLRSTDQCLKYYYDVMSDTSLSRQIEKGLGLDALELFASSLLGAFDEADEYLLDENDILLDTDCIFFTDEGRYRFLYYPGCHGSSPAQLKELAGIFLKVVDYTCAEAVQRVYEFYHLCCGETMILKNLRSYVLKGRTYRDQEKCFSKEREENLTHGEHGPEPLTDPGCHQEKAKILSRERVDVLSGDDPEFMAGNRVKTGKAVDDKNPEEASEDGEKTGWGQPWIILGAVCAAQIGVGMILLKIFQWTSMVFAWTVLIGIGAVTAGIGAVIIYYRNHLSDQEDFWAPQDWENHETVVLQSTAGGILLKSVNPQLYGNVSVTRFPAVIGKEVGDAACRVTVPTVSRRHARIEAVGKSFCLTDLRSTNGTFLNGEMLRPMTSTPLHPGDSVILGNVEFTFELWGETQ